MNNIYSQEGWTAFIETISMEFTDFEDFKKKYDSSVNWESYIKRVFVWNMMDLIGYQYHAGVIDLDAIYGTLGTPVISCWQKFKPVIEGYRKTEGWARDDFIMFEKLAYDLTKMREKITYNPLVIKLDEAYRRDSIRSQQTRSPP